MPNSENGSQTPLSKFLRYVFTESRVRSSPEMSWNILMNVSNERLINLMDGTTIPTPSELSSVVRNLYGWNRRVTRECRRRWRAIETKPIRDMVPNIPRGQGAYTLAQYVMTGAVVNIGLAAVPLSYTQLDRLVQSVLKRMNRQSERAQAAMNKSGS